MLNVNEATVLELADRVTGFAHAWSGERAEAHVAAKVAELRQRFTQDGLDVTPEEALTKVEAQTRQQWDRQALTAGSTVELELRTAAAIVGDRIAAAKVLPATVEPLVSRQERQLEELAALLIDGQLRARFAAQTRRQALDAYTGADETTQAGRRLVTFLEASWSTLTCRDDPEHDAVTLLQMRAAMEARQVARVPKELLEWQARLEAATRSATLTETLRHLRSGRGIAQRPRPVLARLG